MKKKLFFIAPLSQGGTYYYYQQISSFLQINYGEEYDVIFVSSLLGYFQAHFQKADVIFSILPMLRKPLRSQKYIFNLHGNYKIERNNKGRGVKLLYLTELNLRFADKIMLTSYYLADKLGFRTKYEEKIIIIPNYVDISEKIERVPSKTTEEYRMLTVTSFKFYEKGKGIINLKKVIQGLANNTEKSIYWTIVGNDNSENFHAIKSEFDSIIIPDHVYISFLGRQKREEVIKLYQKNNYFIYWTNLDNYPGVVLEALACGMKVLVNNYESFSYFVDNALICHDEKEMQEKISKGPITSTTKLLSQEEVVNFIRKEV